MFMKVTTKTLIIAAICSATFFLVFACTKGVQSSSRMSSSTSSNYGGSMCGFPQTEALTAGQTILAGSMVIENDADSLYVTYNTTDGWKIKELHLSVDYKGGDCTMQKSSDLAPGKFPYSATFTATGSSECGTEGLPTTYRFAIAKTALPAGNCLCLFPHAAVVKCTNGTSLDSQTAWGGNIQQITNGKWYGGTNYCMQDCGDLGK